MVMLSQGNREYNILTLTDSKFSLDGVLKSLRSDTNSQDSGLGQPAFDRIWWYTRKTLYFEITYGLKIIIDPAKFVHSDRNETGNKEIIWEKSLLPLSTSPTVEASCFPIYHCVNTASFITPGSSLWYSKSRIIVAWGFSNHSLLIFCLHGRCLRENDLGTEELLSFLGVSFDRCNLSCGLLTSDDLELEFLLHFERWSHSSLCKLRILTLGSFPSCT
jgi:hypothetical protein